MVNPGSFVSSRAVFLTGEKCVYADAVAQGYTRDVLAIISRRYFKRYLIDLPHDVEPTDEHLASVDDNAICPEDLLLNPNDMTMDDYLAEKLCQEKSAALVDYWQGVSLTLFVIGAVDSQLTSKSNVGWPINS